MGQVIEIAVPLEEIESRRQRVLKAKHFEAPDRIPVMPVLAHRYLIPKVGVRFQEYYADPEVMLRTQILAQKWLLENIRTDAHEITGPWTAAWTDFQNTFEAGSLGCPVIFPEDDIPWVGDPWIRSEKDLRTLEQIDYVHTGINLRQIEFRQRMMEVADKYPVRFQDGPIFYPGETPSFTRTCDGLFGIAGDLMEQTELFTAVLERPDFVRELLRIIADKVIAYLDYCWKEEKLSHRDFAWSEDLAVSLSARSFRDVVLPQNRRLRDQFNGTVSFHMCGNSNHLLEIFRDDLAIDEFIGFGYQVDLDRVASVMGGRVVLIGNVNPMLIRSGTPEEVRDAARRVIQKLGPHRGLILQDGSNIPPGSPLENINALMEAADAFGRLG